MTPLLIGAFQSWMQTKDELVRASLDIATDAISGPVSMEQIGSLMALCFAAGRLSLAAECHTEAVRDELAVTHIPGKGN